MDESLEHILTKCASKQEMITYLETHPEQFEAVVSIISTNQHPHAWRATWMLGHCMDKNDSRIQGQLDTIIKALPGKKDGHQRELLKVLEKMELGEEQEGALFDVCVTIWETINKSPSVRMTAFKFFVKLAKKYPELKNEIRFLMEEHYVTTLTPGVKRTFEKTKAMWDKD